ncbi:uncharacterized protein LOC129216654 [Uloborus diversus]|uniref:uncharacterized protein LOC129216654 n=1 Tax=Uloborus diversus TaxID=327109 RepID=UPI002408F4E4|nr:uncharacterized protein LOC129216654 [Uloborus diversus]
MAKNHKKGRKKREVLAVCCSVVHHEDLAFLGIYAVRKKYRGLGLGLKVWNACLEHIGDRNAALNAVPGKLELYRDRGGFPVVENDFVNLVNETEESVHVENLSDSVPSGVDIQPYQAAHLPLMLKFDFNLIGYKRDLAIRLNCEETDSHTFVAFKDGACVGFGTIKMSCQEVGQVGPLYADDSAVAEPLLKKLILSLPQAKGFAMMTISTNHKANEFIKLLGCPMTEECPRLYKKYALKVDTNKVFAHFDLNFSPF